MQPSDTAECDWLIAEIIYANLYANLKMASLEQQASAENLNISRSSVLSRIWAIDSNLKREQEQAVEKLLLGQDVLAFLPTGFGKSIIFQTYSHVKDHEMNGCSVVLVIVPLASIINDQITTLVFWLPCG